MFLVDNWNDFLGLYLYMYFDNILLLTIIGFFFLVITVSLIINIKLMVLKKINFNNVLLSHENFLYFDLHFEFYSKTYFWESVNNSSICKFK